MIHCSKQSSVDFKPCMTSLFVKCSRSNKSHALGKMCNHSVPHQNTTTMILRPRNVIFIVIVIVVLTKIFPTSGSWRCLAMLCNTAIAGITANTVLIFKRSPKWRHENIFFITPKVLSMTHGLVHAQDCMRGLVQFVACSVVSACMVEQRTLRRLRALLGVVRFQSTLSIVIH